MKKIFLNLAAFSLIGLFAGPAMAGAEGPELCAGDNIAGDKVDVFHKGKRTISVSACDEDFNGMPDCVEHQLCHGDETVADCPTAEFSAADCEVL